MSYIDDLIEYRRSIITNENVELTPELIDNFQKSVYESLPLITIFSEDFEDEFENMIVTEGGNVQATEAFKESLKVVISHIKAAKKLSKQGDIKGGKKELEIALKCTEKTESDIKNMHYNAGSTIFGIFITYFLQSAIVAFVGFIPVFIGGVPLVKGIIKNRNLIDEYDDIFSNIVNLLDSEEVKKFDIGSTIGSIISKISVFAFFIKDAINVYKRFKDGDSGKNAWNMYRTTILNGCNHVKKILNSMIKAYDKKLKESNN